ncbi:MAG: hypothetical protein CL878_02020 [Dehalococcoidia bacterium]|nr:hypothetical protein [Dehalococcoidia bacterium]
MGEATRAAGSPGSPFVVDAHAHVAAVEAQDIVERYMPDEWHGGSHLRLLELMDQTGVDIAVLHNSRPWLNPYLARVNREHPGRFLPLLSLFEGTAHTPKDLDALRRAVHEEGFRGLYYDPWPQSLPAFDRFHEPEFAPLWRTLAELDVPLHMVAYGADAPQSRTSRGNWEILWPGLRLVLDREPSLRVCSVHGLYPGARRPARVLTDGGQVNIPDEVVALVRDHEVYMEVLAGYGAGAFGPNDEVLRAMYDTFGPERLIWGSEFVKASQLPVERRDSLEQYRFQRTYLEVHHPYMTAEDLARIHGENAARLWRL